MAISTLSVAPSSGTSPPTTAATKASSSRTTSSSRGSCRPSTWTAPQTATSNVLMRPRVLPAAPRSTCLVWGLAARLRWTTSARRSAKTTRSSRPPMKPTSAAIWLSCRPALSRSTLGMSTARKSPSSSRTKHRVSVSVDRRRSARCRASTTPMSGTANSRCRSSAVTSPSRCFRN
ncbi:hypothetical protein D3C80_1248460 [compost metagenome]